MPSSIRCGVCGFENPTTSLYCQDCGARLVAPPTGIADAAPPTAGSAGSVRTPPPPPRILSAKKPNPVAKFIVVTIRTLFFAALLAVIILVLRAPQSVPAADGALSEQTVLGVRTFMQQSAQQGREVPIAWSDEKHEGLNAYLAAVLKPGEGRFLGTVFVRALVGSAAEPDCFTLFVERKISGLTVFSTITYRVISNGNGITLEPAGASLGRLALPAFMAPAVLSASGGVDQALSTELDLLRGARKVQISPTKVIVDFGVQRP